MTLQDSLLEKVAEKKCAKCKHGDLVFKNAGYPNGLPGGYPDYICTHHDRRTYCRHAINSEYAVEKFEAKDEA